MISVGLSSRKSVLKGDIMFIKKVKRPPLWYRGQSSWIQIQRSRVRFPVLPDFLIFSGYGTGSTLHRDYNFGDNLMEK
jgi:hypothetical protein